MRFNLLPREAATIIKLRRKGHSINGIATFLGRSTSLVHRIIKINRKAGTLTRFNMRKLGYNIRMRMSAQRRVLLEKLRLAWETWILAEEGEPP